jgi:transcriptional regulator with XRE-family HTH domain
MTPKQVKAARAMLDWSQQDLAEIAGVATSTVADFERGQRTPIASNAQAMRSSLESAGIRFLPNGVEKGKRSLTSVSPLEVISALAAAFGSAESFLPPLPPGYHADLDFVAFNQQFSDTSCGFGGMAGQGFTTAPVIVVFRERNGQAAVFVSGRFAYVVEPNEHPKLAENFWALLDVIHRTIEAYNFKQMATQEKEAKKP